MSAPLSIGSSRLKPADTVLLLDADPDLLAGVDPSLQSLALRGSAVRTFSVGRGRWALPEVSPESAFYILAGAVARRVEVQGRASVEFLGPGHILRPELRPPSDGLVEHVAWRMVSPGWIGILDGDFWTRMAAFPSLTVALLDRGLSRARSLSMRLAMNGTPNLAERIRLLLWHLADSHGRVTSAGVLIDLRLSHETIAELVSATRPSVSTALKQLQTSGDVIKADKGGLLLRRDSGHSPQAVAYGRAATVSGLIESAAAVASSGWPL